MNSIVGAVRRNRILKKPSHSEIENQMKLWLRQSCDANGGRPLRDEKKKGTAARAKQPLYSDVEQSD